MDGRLIEERKVEQHYCYSRRRNRLGDLSVVNDIKNTQLFRREKTEKERIPLQIGRLHDYGSRGVMWQQVCRVTKEIIPK